LYDPGTIVAVDVDDGRERWTRRIDIDGSPILLADTDRLVLVDAWFPEQSTLYVLDHDGNVLGQADGPSSPRVTLRDGSITLVAAADQFVVETYDADTLERTWRNAIELDHDARIQIATSPEYVVATADSEQPVPTRLLGFDRHNGDQRWQTAVSGTDHPRTIALSLAIGDDTVYVGNNDGSVYAFGLADGTERWRIESAEELGEYEPLGRTVEPIVVGDGRLYLWDGQELLALEEP
jgi:outer membrane protein assembly factor BamB